MPNGNDVETAVNLIRKHAKALGMLFGVLVILGGAVIRFHLIDDRVMRNRKDIDMLINLEIARHGKTAITRERDMVAQRPTNHNRR